MKPGPLLLFGGAALLLLAASKSQPGQRAIQLSGALMSDVFDRLWSRLLVSGTATRLKIENVPTEEHKANLRRLVEKVLIPLTLHVGRVVDVTSGYRSPEVNRHVPGSSSTSQHSLGEAADIKVEGMTATELAAAILLAGIEFDQMIAYPEHLGGHVHISFTVRRANRRQVLWAHAEGTYVAWNPSKGPGRSA